MKSLSTRLLLLTLCSIGINACGSENQADPAARVLKPYGTDSLIKNPVITSTTGSADLSVAKSASFTVNFPDAQMQSCIESGNKAAWKITSAATTALTLENSSACELTIKTAATFKGAMEVILEGKFTSSENKEFVYTLTLTPAACPAGLTAAATANSDGSLQCVQPVTTGTLCTDDLALATMSYSAANGAHLLFGGSGPSDHFKINNNCTKNTKVDLKLNVFDEAQEYVTKGHIRIKGRMPNAAEYDFCINPAEPKKLYFKPTTASTVLNFHSLTLFTVSTIVAYFPVDAGFDDQTDATITLTNASVRHGETDCGDGFSAEAAYQN